MLKIFDKKHNAIGHTSKYKDCKIESDISTGDKTLSFLLLDTHDIQNEYYIQTEDDEYVVKETPQTTGSFSQIVAVLNLEDLEKDMWQTFSVSDTTIDEAVRTVLTGTGWTIGECDVTKRRNAGMIHVSTLEVIQNLCTAFMCEPAFDTINKKVSFYLKRGEDKGVYFLPGLNLKKIQKKSTSYDYYTRIIPIGANNLNIESVNDGKNYLENYQYSDKVLTYIWKDESYTDAQALKEDAELKLEDLSKPEVSYQVDVRDLANQKKGYSLLSYRLGDTVTLLDQETGTKEKQRIVKLTEYPQNPEKNTCELANTMLTFEEMQQKVQAAAQIINYAIAGDGRYTGTIHVSDILHFEQGLAGSATIGGMQGSIVTMEGELAQIKLAVGEIETGYLKADEAELKYATITQLNATNAEVHSIRGDYASFKTVTTDELSAQKGIIDNLSGQFSSYQTQMAQELIAAKGWMLEGSIGSAQIADLDVNKLNAGTLDTTLIRLASPDSAIQITGSQVLVNDTADALKPMNRVVLGKYTDAEGKLEYGLLVRSTDGKTVMIDGDGVHNAGITDGAIDNNKVADDANISGKKLDIESVVTEINEGKTKISQTIIQVGDKSLDIVLREQTQEISDTKSNSVYRVDVLYALSDSVTFPPEEGWSANAPDWTPGKYMWQKTVTIYRDGNTNETEPSCLSGAAGQKGEDATVLRIDSSRGTVFKNSEIFTVLEAVIYNGPNRITDIQTLHRIYGAEAYLEWSWQRMDENRFGVISVDDTRISNDGFSLTLTPADVDTKATFKCELKTD